MKRDIYYFSGTGNSCVIAKEIAQKTNSQIINIPKVINKNPIAIDADIIGIVFPIYYMELPQIVDKFLNLIEVNKDAYIYAVVTFGGGKGGALKRINELLYKKGCRLSAFYGVRMPQNSFNKPFDNYERCYKNSKKMIDIICDNVEKKNNGIYYSSKLVNALQAVLYPLLSKIVYKELPKKIQLDNNASLGEVILNLDRTIKVNENCTHCGICMTVCSVKNIEFTDGNPVWKHSCENCLSCYNFCPQKAIEFDIVDKDYHYLHPEYTIRDAIDNNF